jgi:hypothetical protein
MGEEGGFLLDLAGARRLLGKLMRSQASTFVVLLGNRSCRDLAKPVPAYLYLTHYIFMSSLVWGTKQNPVSLHFL